MRILKLGHLAALGLLLVAAVAFAQDQPSLGDLARKQRAEKKLSKPSQPADVKSARVITNEELSQHAAGSSVEPAAHQNANDTDSTPSADTPKQSADEWKSEIQSQKSQVAALQKQIDEMNGSIQFAPANCVENCVQWNQKQQEKQQEVERMRATFEEMKSRLEHLQESARSQGYGSSVWDP